MPPMHYRRQWLDDLADLSLISHKLSGQHRAQAHSLDIRRILTCGYGFWRTDRTYGIDLRMLPDRAGP